MVRDLTPILYLVCWGNFRAMRDPSLSPAAARLFSPGRKRILTLDGGGVRGIISIAFLKEMETQLRDATGKKDLVLSDVFDLVAGTSVGSMFATMISLGKPATEIEAEFRNLAPKIFSGRNTLFGQKRFSALPLVNGVRSIVKDERLGSPKLLTGLAIIAKRVDTAVFRRSRRVLPSRHAAAGGSCHCRHVRGPPYAMAIGSDASFGRLPTPISNGK